jgi:hypothetical protein
MEILGHSRIAVTLEIYTAAADASRHGDCRAVRYSAHEASWSTLKVEHLIRSPVPDVR